MPSLIISKNSNLYRVFALEGKTRIGRDPNSDVVLDGIGVSRIHATIEQSADGFELIDNGSTNGTFIDNLKVDRTEISHGTSFRIHDFLCTFVNDIREKDEPDLETATISELDAKTIHINQSLWLTRHVKQKTALAEKLSQSMRLVSDLSSGTTPAEDIGSYVLSSLLELTAATRGLLAKHQPTGKPVITHVKGFKSELELSNDIRTTLKKVLRQGECVFHRCDAAEPDPEGTLETKLSTLICVPLVKGMITVGCLYLDHLENEKVFSEIDRNIVIVCSEYIAGVIYTDQMPTCELNRDEKQFSNELASEGIIANSIKTVKVFQDAQSIAQYDVAVLLYGETGTGKEVIARYIHSISGRSGQFIACNCSAIAASMFESELFGHEKGAFTGAVTRKPGLLELADSGTLFLDEIGDMPFEQQSKLLRALQEQEIWRVGGRAPVKINVRIVAATHQDIKNDRKALNFRDDLYYRLANVEITAPSLRDRLEDIGPLAQMVLVDLAQRHQNGKKPLSISDNAVRLLQAYGWPGNIRELRNTLFQIALKCDGTTIEPRHLKDHLDVFASPSRVQTRQIPALIDVERAHIIKALEHVAWNKSAAAKILKMDRNRLNRRLKKFGIEQPN